MDYLIRQFKGLNLSKNKKKKGTGKRFGYFQCKRCNRKWQSAHTWKDYSQDCKKCGSAVVPYRQELLVPSENGIDKNKVHPMELCEKCLELGYPCTEEYHD